MKKLLIGLVGLVLVFCGSSFGYYNGLIQDLYTPKGNVNVVVDGITREAYIGIPFVMPLQNYAVTDVDGSGTVKYFGFTDAGGGWYIMKDDASATVESFRFVKGADTYSTNWTGRAGLTYEVYSVTF